MAVPTPERIARRAAELDVALRPWVRETPVVTWRSLADPDRSVLLKLENLQVTGSFKARGAAAKLAQVAEAGGTRVIAASTGNHGLAVAAAARRHGIDVTVFVPRTAAPSKVAALSRQGAAVRPVDGDPMEAELAAREAASSERIPYVSPYNDAEVVAGQATLAVELVRRLEPVDAVYVAVGGGGLISGIGSVLRAAWPECTIVAAYPERSPAMAASVAAGRIVTVDLEPTLSDGTAGGIEPDAITFPLCSDLVDRWVAVPEDAIEPTIRRVLAYDGLLVEGAAAVALHAAAQGTEATGVAVVCGGNVDLDRLGTRRHSSTGSASTRTE